MLDADDNPKIGGFGLTETLTPELSRDESLRDYRESEQHLRLPVRCGDRYDMPYPLSSPSKTKTEHSLTCIMQSKHTHTHTHTHFTHLTHATVSQLSYDVDIQITSTFPRGAVQMVCSRSAWSHVLQHRLGRMVVWCRLHRSLHRRNSTVWRMAREQGCRTSHERVCNLDPFFVC